MKLYLKGRLLLLTVFTLLIACSNENRNAYEDKIMPNLSKSAIIEILLAQKKSMTSLTEEELTQIILELDKDEFDRGELPTSSKLWILVPKEINKYNHYLLSGHITTGSRAWQVNPKRNTFLLLRDQKTGAISVKKTSRLKGQQQAIRKQQITPLSAQGEAPNELNASAWRHSLEKIDILYNFSEALTAGNYTITQVYYDQKTSSEHFIFHSESNEQLIFPKVSNAKVNTHSVELKFVKNKSNISNWKLNLIAFKLDEEPIIMPLKIDLTSNKDSLTFPFDKVNFENGIYQIYIDTGNELEGPFELIL
ncbi:hypothetical protein [Psychromonas algicola]|uniref:hypothetical protein n=1 Tax=Psychromonas algicola TaxID=2555642 RepID=UPI001068B7CA|nr:hypothetical protein [Psychromonas sp. RZ5]TEW52382.1 hypothetical protein E2R67_03480 [Psychromonas sp. RZ5]